MRLMQTKVLKIMTLRDLINKLLGRETASAIKQEKDYNLC